MTQAAAVQTDVSAAPESFWGIVFRRTRYVFAIAVSAFLFWHIGWRLVAPPAERSGIALLIWPNAGGVLVAVGLVVLLMIVSAICTLLVHPDSPHMGLFCALVGLASLSIRGGTSGMLVRFAQGDLSSKNLDHYATVSVLLAVECVQWAILVLIAEMFVRMLHDRFFANTHWLSRSGPGVTDQAIRKFGATRSALGVSLAVSQFIGTAKFRRRIASPLAFLTSGVIAYVLLYVLLQSDQKGQVFFACYLAFFLSTLLTYVAFPRVPAVVFFLTVPVTAAVAYFLGRHDMGMYPGSGGAFVTRALPIDFIATGIPGAILGYYAGIQWSLHSDDSTP